MLLIGGGLVSLGFVGDSCQRIEPAFLEANTGIKSMCAGLQSLPLMGAESAPISAKLGGVLAMFGAVAILFVMPWFDSHPVRSAKFRPLFKLSLLIFTALVFLLGYIGSQPADAAFFGVPLSLLGLLSTGYYFFFFVVILPLLSRFEKAKDLPESIHQAVLDKQKKKEALA